MLFRSSTTSKTSLFSIFFFKSLLKLKVEIPSNSSLNSIYISAVGVSIGNKGGYKRFLTEAKKLIEKTDITIILNKSIQSENVFRKHLLFPQSQEGFLDRDLPDRVPVDDA